MGIFSKLFGSGDKDHKSEGEKMVDVMAQMNKLSYTSSFAVGMMIIHDLGADNAKTDTEREALHARGSIQAELMFGRSLDSNISRSIIDAEYKALLAWLERRPEFKELVVQMLRVEGVLAYARTGKAPDPVIGKDILERFGKLYPALTGPEPFNELLARALRSMPQQLSTAVIAHVNSM